MLPTKAREPQDLTAREAGREKAKMKVKMTADSKRLVNLEDAKMVNRIIREMKDDEETAEGYARYAVNAASEYGTVKVYEAEAEIVKNSRVWNAYGDDTKDFDIWINATARTSDGFMDVGAYLTDIWALTGDNHNEIAKSYMYIRKYSECK